MTHDLASIRRQFIDHFARDGHLHLPSAPLVPSNDPTLLFTNSGMVPFKNIFTGNETPPAPTAVTVQKCIRAGGKHNDLENVGFTARHHTFFEMMGNFSFGTYFKEHAIESAWGFVTKTLGLDPTKLLVTVYHTDDDAIRLWKSIANLSDDRIIRIDTSDNFWQMGPTGPCGPCSEIFFDHGDTIPGGPPGSPDEDGDRFIEIWNLVFMQHEQFADGNRTDLPHPSIDTGMGLERIAAVMQGVTDNYDTDLFRQIMGEAEALTRTAVTAANKPSFKVLADHARAVAFMVADGITPSNEGRGYVLRRILRRAMRHANSLGHREVFLTGLVQTVIDSMSGYYTELTEASPLILDTVANEEQRFIDLLDRGMRLLTRAVADHQSAGVLPGELAFTLYDRYGFPFDLTADVLRGHGMTVDEPGFNAAMGAQQQRGRASWKGYDAAATLPKIPASWQTTFTGYALDSSAISASDSLATPPAPPTPPTPDSSLESSGDSSGDSRQESPSLPHAPSTPTHYTGNILGLIDDGQTVNTLTPHAERLPATDAQAPATDASASGGTPSSAALQAVIVDQSPFYGEAGGQQGDCGFITDANGGVFQVHDTQHLHGVLVHWGQCTAGTLHTASSVTLSVDTLRRAGLRQHHSATHLLHAALRRVLGTGVTQKGSLVTPSQLRFDFSHHAPLSVLHRQTIEQLVNAEIRKNTPVQTQLMPLDEAKAAGAMALFGEKYADDVRVVRMGDTFSTELCGGTHVDRTGDIGTFVIESESGVAAGVRRITAMAGEAATMHWQKQADLLHAITTAVKAPADQVVLRIERLQAETKEWKHKAESQQGTGLQRLAFTAPLQDGRHVAVVLAYVEGADKSTNLKAIVDTLRREAAPTTDAGADVVAALYVVAGVASSGTTLVVAGTSMDSRGVVRALAPSIGAKGGGGKPDMAQTGGSTVLSRDGVTNALKQVIAEMVVPN
ncbi:MAG: alanine--tRNA ligase [Alphaproteobacteria bacterium]|nr:alanine--tRNA ligase [Alphaproteobacteria bacterium]